MQKSKIIAFCGIDGSGKSTQLQLVRKSLEKDYKVFVAKLEYFPLNQMGHSKVVDTALKARSGLEIMSYYFHLQFFEASQYDYILCDRHLLCYLAYAIAYDVKQIDLVRKILSFINDPDLTLYFDIAVGESLNRIARRGEPIDKSENEEILSKAKLGYAYLMQKMENVETINSDGTLEETTEQVAKTLQLKFQINMQ